MADWKSSTYADATHSIRTRQRYLEQYRVWERWCRLKGVNALPATVDALATHVVERADAGIRASTIVQMVSALRWMHDAHDYPSPTDDIDLKRLVQGIRRDQAAAPAAQVAGLTDDCLQRVAAVTDQTSRHQRETLVMCLVMRDALLRCAEAAAVQWQDIDRDDDGSGSLLIRQSKTDQFGVGHVLYLSPETVRLLDTIRPGKDAVGRVFPMHPRTIGRRIQAAAARAGLEGRFRGHSPRVGMALDLADNGASLVEMQHAGRWKSPVMPAHYTRSQRAKKSAVAKLYQKRSTA